ncbi:MAG TPA: hypothetical protein VIY27_07875 [Myxococcota bacterium]
MGNSSSTTEASGVLFEEGVLLTKTLHEIVEEDAEVLCRMSLRYRGVLAELVGFRSVNSEEPDAGADTLVESAIETVRAIEFATASLRDFDDDLEAYALDDDDEDTADGDEEE